MKQLVILSGKGGTGKTSLTAAFAHLASQSRYAGQIILADADVDAANLELVLQPRLLEEQEFKGGQVAVIDQETCTSCGDCQAVCRFDAINYSNGMYVVDPIACDGCAACVYQCPTESIAMHEQVVGEFYSVRRSLWAVVPCQPVPRTGKFRQAGHAGQAARAPASPG